MVAKVARQHDQTGAEIVVLRPAVNERAARTAQPLLSPGERRRAARYFRAADRFRYVEVCARRRLLLAARLGIPFEEVDIVAGTHGKPALAAGAPVDLRFNTSHSGDLAAFAFAVGREVGIDIEACRPAPDLDTVADQVLSDAERSAYHRLGPSDRPLAFYQAWTRKEAFAKADGRGLSLSLDGFDVSLGPHEPARILRVGTTPGDRCGWRLWSFSPAPGFVGALVMADRS
jgi:4'-phosphopantetheinyl transferase